MILRVYAMARPARPACEGDLVRAAANERGTVAQRAKSLAYEVTRVAIEDMDLAPSDRIVALLRIAAGGPVERLATDPDIDTAAMIVTERMRRLAARGGRRLPESEWADEDREVLEVVAEKLSRRYRRLLP